MYRVLICLSCSLLGVGGLHAQQQQKVTIQHVTVFLSGAELETTARVSLPAGGGEVLFTNIAGDINEESINVGTDNSDVAIQSVTFQKNYLGSDLLSPLAQSYKDSITLLTTQKQQTDNRLSVVNEQLAVLKANERVGGNNTGLSTIDLQKMLDLVNAKMGTYLEEKSTLEAKAKKLEEHIKKLTQQLDEEESRPAGQLLVRFYSKRSSEAKVHISYETPSAQWTPSYDIRSEKENELSLIYKASIQQNTGVIWDNVRLTLSISNPVEAISAPRFEKHELSFYVSPTYQRYNKAEMMKTNVQIEKNPVVTTDELAALSPTPITNIYSNALTTTYDIALPYTNRSKDDDQLITFYTRTIPAAYHYYTYPKTAQSAFLQADITKWDDMTLITGSANIFYNGTYVGQTKIDPVNVTDTLTFSLGRDKKIVVKRTQDTKMRSTKTIGSNVKEQYGYTIAVRNTHSQPVDIVITDQVPVSTDKDISVEDIETSGGTYNETTGEVNWRLTLNANEAREFKLGYTIKYPKGKTLNGH